jgi:integrase
MSGKKSYVAHMTGDQEVSQKGPTGAKGTAKVDIDAGAGQVCYELTYRFHKTYSGVDGDQRITTVAGRWRDSYRGMLADLDGRGGDRRVPVVRVRRFGRERPPVLSPEQVEAILEDCATFDASEGHWVGSLRDRLLFETLGETGMRLGECLALEHGDWHLGRGGVPFIEIAPRLDYDVSRWPTPAAASTSRSGPAFRQHETTSPSTTTAGTVLSAYRAARSAPELRRSWTVTSQSGQANS